MAVAERQEHSRLRAGVPALVDATDDLGGKREGEQEREGEGWGIHRKNRRITQAAGEMKVGNDM